MDHKRPGPLSWPVQPGTTATPTGRLSWCAAVARWAPSKHNTQPWRFVLQDEALDVWTDPSRILANIDPHRREMLISCGAAVHFACVAARALGYQPFVELLPRGAGGPAARLTAVGRCDVTDDDRELLGAVRDRRTDRGPLDGDALPVGLPFLLQAAAAANGAELRLLSTPGDRATLAALVAGADRLLVRTGHYEELAPWLREPGDLRRDGVPTDHTRGAAASYRTEFIQRDFSSSTSQPARYQRRPDRPLLGVLSTQTDDPPSWLRAGQALGAVLLRATLAGAHASYLSLDPPLWWGGLACRRPRMPCCVWRMWLATVTFTDSEGASAGCEFLTRSATSLRCSMIRILSRARGWHRWSLWPSGVA